MYTWPRSNELRHVPVEERQEERADVRAVDVGVGHHDDPVVPQLLGSNSSPMPVPIAVIIAWISLFESTLLMRFFSLLMILPRSGRIAW